MIYIPISLGELVDKVTILQIKINKITDIEKLQNVKKEYNLLEEIMLKYFDKNNKLYNDLYNLNLKFWEYHDWQREQWKNYDDNFINIELYKKNRMEHIMNDQRAQLKKQINNIFNSEIIEEKQFISYEI